VFSGPGGGGWIKSEVDLGGFGWIWVDLGGFGWIWVEREAGMLGGLRGVEG
jgi:hypothetical protein